MTEKRMKVYCYNEYDNPELVYMSEKDILDRYWNYWKSQMENKYGPGHELTTEENCIDDWCVLHHAWESVV
jgi:hypothetical protein